MPTPKQSTTKLCENGTVQGADADEPAPSWLRSAETQSATGVYEDFQGWDGRHTSHKNEYYQ
jgi:hypothetical protein